MWGHGSSLERLCAREEDASTNVDASISAIRLIDWIGPLEINPS